MVILFGDISEIRIIIKSSIVVQHTLCFLFYEF
jgi:hypothetical protein